MINDSISVIIVTYNSSLYILDCLKSLVKQNGISLEIIVIDNNSVDNTVKIIQASGVKVKLLLEADNLGFAKANNLGVKNATCEYLLFLNPDTKLPRADILKNLKQALASNPSFGIIGPRLVLADGSIQKSVRNLPTLKRLFEEYIFKKRNSYNFYVPSCQDCCAVESVVGACMIIRKDIFEKAGGFNEKYFMYFEDLELCKTVRNMGLKIGYLPQVKIQHAEGASGAGQKTYNLLHESAKKYHGLFSYYIIQGILRLTNAFS